jgi:hypothetical protein
VNTALYVQVRKMRKEMHVVHYAVVKKGDEVRQKLYTVRTNVIQSLYHHSL